MRLNFTTRSIITPPAEYCDDRACLSVCVCLSASLISGTTRPIFTNVCLLPMAVARSLVGGVAIRYVLPVLWMTSYMRISQGTQRDRPADGSTVHMQPRTWL